MLVIEGTYMPKIIPVIKNADTGQASFFLFCHNVIGKILFHGGPSALYHGSQRYFFYKEAPVSI